MQADGGRPPAAASHDHDPQRPPGGIRADRPRTSTGSGGEAATRRPRPPSLEFLRLNDATENRVMTRRRRALRSRHVQAFPARAFPAGYGSSNAIEPLSSSDFRLEMIFGQPPDTAVMSFEGSRSIVWVME